MHVPLGPQNHCMTAYCEVSWWLLTCVVGDFLSEASLVFMISLVWRVILVFPSRVTRITWIFSKTSVWRRVITFAIVWAIEGNVSSVMSWKAHIFGYLHCCSSKGGVGCYVMFDHNILVSLRELNLWCYLCRDFLLFFFDTKGSCIFLLNEVEDSYHHFPRFWCSDGYKLDYVDLVIQMLSS